MKQIDELLTNSPYYVKTMNHPTTFHYYFSDNSMIGVEKSFIAPDPFPVFSSYDPFESKEIPIWYKEIYIQTHELYYKTYRLKYLFAEKRRHLRNLIICFAMEKNLSNEEFFPSSDAKFPIVFTIPIHLEKTYQELKEYIAPYFYRLTIKNKQEDFLTIEIK